MLSKTNQTGFWQWVMRVMAVGGGEGEEGGAVPSEAPWWNLSSARWWQKVPAHWKVITRWGLKWREPAIILSEGAPLLDDTPLLVRLGREREHVLASLASSKSSFNQQTHFFPNCQKGYLNTKDNTQAIVNYSNYGRHLALVTPFGAESAQ